MPSVALGIIRMGPRAAVVADRGLRSDAGRDHLSARGGKMERGEENGVGDAKETRGGRQEVKSTRGETDHGAAPPGAERCSSPSPRARLSREGISRARRSAVSALSSLPAASALPPFVSCPSPSLSSRQRGPAGSGPGDPRCSVACCHPSLPQSTGGLVRAPFASTPSPAPGWVSLGLRAAWRGANMVAGLPCLTCPTSSWERHPPMTAGGIDGS